jgi:hypothetical protein
MGLYKHWELYFLTLLAASCQGKSSKVCSTAQSLSTMTKPAASLFTLAITEDGKSSEICTAVHVSEKKLLTSLSCITSLCGDKPETACLNNLSLRQPMSGETATISSVLLYPGYKNINRITVDGSDLALLLVDHTLKAPYLSRMDEDPAKRVLDDNVGRTSDLDDRQNLVISKTDAAGGFTWLPVSFRFSLGVKSQEVLAGYTRTHACYEDRGGALLGRMNISDPYQLIGILSRGFPGEKWPTDCADSDGNIFSVIYDKNVVQWLESNGVKLVENNQPLPPTPTHTPTTTPGPSQGPTSDTCG